MMSTPKSVIRKYGNRRLYDTGSSRYVNLDEIARMIREGQEVEVVDARTGDDLTRIILTQIIMEDARGHDGGLPLRLLRQLVIASDRITHDFLSWYLDTALDLYHRAQSTVRSGVAEARQAVVSPLDFVRQLVTRPAGAPDAEIQELRRRIEELEAKLAARAPRRKRATARSSSR